MKHLVLEYALALAVLGFFTPLPGVNINVRLISASIYLAIPVIISEI